MLIKSLKHYLPVNTTAAFFTAYLCLVFTALLFEHGFGRQAFRSLFVLLLLIPFIKIKSPWTVHVYAALGAAFSLLTYLSNYISPFVDDWSSSSTILHWLLILPAFYACILSKPSLNKLFWVLACALSFSIVPAIYDLTNNLDRYDGFHGQPIMWGNLAILTGFTCFYIALTLDRKTLWVIGFILFLAGIFISSVSQSRGGWITVLTLSPFLFMEIYKAFSKKFFILIVVVILGFFFFILTSDQLGLNTRFVQGFKNVAAYVEGDENAGHSSIGNRFEFWRSAFRAIEERPFWGLGFKGFHNWIAQDTFYNGGLRYQHAHNQYIDLLLFGLPSFFTFLMLIIFFISISFRSERNDNEIVVIRKITLILVVAYMEFSLTESFWTSRLGSGYFILFSAYILSLIYFDGKNLRKSAG